MKQAEKIGFDNSKHNLSHRMKESVNPRFKSEKFLLFYYDNTGHMQQGRHFIHCESMVCQKEQ